MSETTSFRTGEQEITKLLQECIELKHTLRTISAQVSRMELRLKRAFPEVAKQIERRQSDQRAMVKKLPTISPGQALEHFDKVVDLAQDGHNEEAEHLLMTKSPEDLLLIARELGVSFRNSKPSVQTVREAIFGKVRESVQLSRHRIREPRPEHN